MSRQPVAVSRPGSGVFQYLGTFGRPRQIALATGRSRTIVDLRASLDRRHKGLSSPSFQDEEDSSAMIDLVQRWERMRLAQVTAGSQEVEPTQ